MIKYLFAWNFKRKQTKIYKQSALQVGSKKKSKHRPTTYDFTGDGFYSHEPRARRSFFPHIIALTVVLTILIWFFLESAKGWYFHAL